MRAQQKTLDTVAAGTYTAVVSSHRKPKRRVKGLMAQVKGNSIVGLHPFPIVIGWCPPSFDRYWGAGGAPFYLAVPGPVRASFKNLT